MFVTFHQKVKNYQHLWSNLVWKLINTEMLIYSGAVIWWSKALLSDLHLTAGRRCNQEHCDSGVELAHKPYICQCAWPAHAHWPVVFRRRQGWCHWLDGFKLTCQWGTPFGFVHDISNICIGCIFWWVMKI